MKMISAISATRINKISILFISFPWRISRFDFLIIDYGQIVTAPTPSHRNNSIKMLFSFINELILIHIYGILYSVIGMSYRICVIKTIGGQLRLCDL